MLEVARKARARVVLNLAGSKPKCQNPDGSFNLEDWKAGVDRYKGINLGPYIADGTLLGHLLMDEPHTLKKWKGEARTLSRHRSRGEANSSGRT